MPYMDVIQEPKYSSHQIRPWISKVVDASDCDSFVDHAISISTTARYCPECKSRGLFRREFPAEHEKGRDVMVVARESAELCHPSC